MYDHPVEAPPGTHPAITHPRAVRDFTGENLVFIVGAPRSGTTWLQRLLASHPRIKSGQESHLFAYIGPLLRTWRKAQDRTRDPHAPEGRGGVGLQCYFSEDQYFRCLKDYLNSLLEVITAAVEPGEFFLEKTPGHALFISEIAELLPRGRFIHLIRDPRDVVASLLAASREWGSRWAPREATAAANLWLRHVRRARTSGVELPAEMYREIHYEELLRAPSETLVALADFIEIDWSPEAIEEAIEANRPEALRNGGGTPLPLFGEVGKRREVVVEPATFVRKAQAGSWKNDLSVTEKLQVWRVVRRAMQEFGYSWTVADWR